MKKINSIAAFILGLALAAPIVSFATIQGLDLSSANTSIIGPLTVANGGTGLTVAPSRTVFQASPLNPTGTTSSSRVMMGMGTTLQVTPTTSGNLLISLNWSSLSNNTAGDSANGQVCFGLVSGGVPANGAAVTGTCIGGGLNATSINANQSASGSTTLYVTGLTVGQAYWFDTSLRQITGGTATISNVTFSAMEE